MKKRVLLGMSGGGDSAVTAVLLKNQGYQVLGCYLKLSDSQPEASEYWEKEAVKRQKAGSIRNKVASFSMNEEEEEKPRQAFFRSHCLDGSSAKQVSELCERFDIPFYEIDMRDEFAALVVDPFVHAMLQRRSHFACHGCTVDIKVRALLRKADELGCDLIATGHYAQIIHESAEDIYILKRAVDPVRDQTFELSGLSQADLKRCLMPLGGLSQGMVRKLAQEFGFEFRARVSGHACFLKSAELIPFLEQRISPSLRPAGVIRTADGDVVGDHDGLYQFQIGQTEDLRLSMQDGKKNLQVVGFEPIANVLVVGETKDLITSEVRLSSVNWLASVDELKQVQCRMRIQDLAEELPVTVFCFENQTAHVYLKEPIGGLASGMRAVLMEGDRVLGGGILERIDSK